MQPGIRFAALRAVNSPFLKRISKQNTKYVRWNFVQDLRSYVPMKSQMKLFF